MTPEQLVGGDEEVAEEDGPVDVRVRLMMTAKLKDREQPIMDVGIPTYIVEKFLLMDPKSSINKRH